MQASTEVLSGSYPSEGGIVLGTLATQDDLGKVMGEFCRHFLKKSNQIQLDFNINCFLT